jgi:hypothetical protein
MPNELLARSNVETLSVIIAELNEACITEKGELEKQHIRTAWPSTVAQQTVPAASSSRHAIAPSSTSTHEVARVNMFQRKHLSLYPFKMTLTCGTPSSLHIFQRCFAAEVSTLRTRKLVFVALSMQSQYI